MITVLYDHSEYDCFYAAKSDHEIVLYDENRNVTEHICNIYGNEWNYISIFGGEWEELQPEPTSEEKLQAKIDQMQADLDYCLMLLDEV